LPTRGNVRVSEALGPQIGRQTHRTKLTLPGWNKIGGKTFLAMRAGYEMRNNACSTLLALTKTFYSTFLCKFVPHAL